MKKVLSLLVTYVLLQTQTWALSGGPVFPGTSALTDVTGTFAGVLTPIGLAVGTPAVGVFTLSVPSTGLASGAFNYFITGNVFVGTMTGAADPENDSVIAFLRATATSQQYLTTVTFVGNPPLPVFTVSLSTINTGTASGTLEAEVTGAKGSQDRSAVGARLKGNASLTVVRGPTPPGGTQDGFPESGVTDFIVTGFRQAP